MKGRKELEKNIKKSTCSVLVIALLFCSAIFSPAPLVFSNVTSAVSTSAEADAPSTVLDIKVVFETTPLLGVNARLMCSVESELTSPETEVSVKLPDGIALVSGDLEWLGDIPAGGKIKIKAMAKAVQVGNWTIHAEAKSRKYPLFHDVEEVHVFVLEDATYIGEPPFAPLSVPVETPPIVEEPLLHQGIVPEAGQPSQPSPEPSSPGFVVTGRHYCYISQDSISGHTSDIHQPQSWGNVWIYRTDNVYLGGGVTGPGGGLGEGYFSIDIGSNPYPKGFYVVMTPYTSACRVLKPDETDYTSYSINFYPSSGATTYDVGGWRPPDTWDYQGAWRIYQSIVQDHYDRGAWDFMVNEGPGYTPPIVIVRFKMASGHGTHIHRAEGIIDIDTEAYSRALDVAQHEYGHWVMHNVYGGYWPPGAGGPHSINRISNPGMAWTEGWANAFPLICQSYGRWEDWYFEWGTGLKYDLETCPDCDPGDQCEGRVAGSLWDVFDAHIDGHDYFVINLPWHSPNHFLDIWSVVSSQTDAKYLEFYQAWRARGKDRHLLNYCSYQNTIDYDNSPDLTGGYVAPSTGFTNTEFEFYVKYQDIDWDPPGSTSQSSLRSESNPYGWLRLYVYDGGWTYYNMDHHSGNPEGTEWFYKKLSGFSIGDHNFYFYAYDGTTGGEDLDPDTGYYSFHVDPCTVHLESREDTGATSYFGTIRFDGSTYTLPNNVPKAAGSYQAQYNPPAGYSFVRWETSGSVTVSNPTSNPTTAIVKCDGTLRAIYQQIQCQVYFNTNPSDVGSITFKGNTYVNGNIDMFPWGTEDDATANPAEGWEFDHWEAKDYVIVTDPDLNPTRIRIECGGALIAVFKQIQCEVTFITDPVGLDFNITFMGNTYHNDTVDTFPWGTSDSATANGPEGYVFDRWEISGDVTVSSAKDNPTTVTVSGDGNLTAIYVETIGVNLYQVVRGFDNRIYYRIYSSSDSWESWNALPGATCDSPAAAVCQNELHIVVRGMDGNTLWHGYVNLSDSTFSSWAKLSGWTPSAPTLTSNGTVLSLVVRGGNNRIYYRTYSCSSRVWGGWNVLPNGLTCDSPAAAMLGNDLHIVVRGFSATDVYGNYSLWHIIVNPNVGVVRGWVSISGYTPSKPTLAANQTANKLYLVVRGLNDRIYWRTYDAPPTDSWESWNPVPTGSTCDGPGATIADNKLHVVVRGSDGSTLWHRYYDFSTGTYSDWTKLSGSTPSPPTLTS